MKVFTGGGGGFASIMSAGLVGAVLVLVGILHALIVLAFAWAAAYVAWVAIVGLATVGKWAAPPAPKSLVPALRHAFIAFTVATVVVDVLTGGGLSVPGMIVVLDTPACAGCITPEGRMIPLIQSMGAFFAHVLGTNSLSWTLALASLLPGLAAFLVAFVNAQDEDVGMALFGGRSAFTRLLAASAASIAAAYVTVFPLFVWVFLGLRNAAA